MTDEMQAAADEIARLSLFGHGVACKSKPHASTREDELDTSCNLCAAVHRYHQKKIEAHGDGA